MSSTGHLPELESLRSQVADLARELAERDQAMQARQQGVDGELQDLRKQSDLLRAIMEGTAADTGDDFFASLATHLTSTLHMQYAVIGEILDGTPARIRTLAVSSGGHLLDNFEYDLAQAPCGTGLTESFWCFTQGVQTLFPNFPPLAAMGVESHSGVSIRNKQGKVVGLIVMMDTKPIASQDRLQTLLKVFAPRAAAELHRKHAEYEHRRALHELQNIMETVPDFMFTLDTQGNMVKWNRRVEEVTGYSPEELRSKSALAFVPAQEQEHTAAAIQRAFTDGYAELKGHLLTKDQRTIPYHWTGAALKDPQGRIIGITGIGRDVSEQKQAAESLQRQRHHLLEAQALAHLGSWEWDIESGETDWSEEQFRIFGYEPGAVAVIYDTFLAALLPDDHDRVLAAINDALLGKRPLDLECRIVRPNGEVRVVHIRADVQRDSAVHPVTMAGTVLDITERKQVEEALRASEERWHLAVRGSNDGIWDWNIQTGKVFYSSRWKTMRGFSDHEIADSVDEWRSRIHPDDLDRVLQSTDSYLAKHTSEFSEEYRVQRKDGSYMWILDRGLALWADDGTPIRMVGSESDITERKQALLRLAQRESLLRSILAAEPECIKRVAADGTLLQMNEAGLCFIETDSFEEVAGRSVYDLVAPEFLELFRSMHEAVLQGASQQLEFQIVGLKGTRRWMETHAVPLWNPIDRRVEHLAITRDISERKRAEDEQKRLLTELAESQKHFEHIFHWTPSAVAISTLAEGRFLDVNDRLVQLTGYSREELVGHTTTELQLWADPPERTRVIQEILQQRSLHNKEGLLRTKSGDIRAIMVSVDRIQVNATPCLIYVAHDITERKQAEALLQAQKHVLELVTSGAPLRETLDTLVRLIEAQSDGVLGSILLLDEEGLHLRHGASPSLPDEYTGAIDGAAIGPSAGSCGTAAFRREMVIVEDIAADPLWENYRHLALPHGLRACWSTPILSKHTSVWGTFAMYYREPRRPSPHDLQIIEHATRLAAIAIVRKQAEDVLAERVRLATFTAELNALLNRNQSIEEMLDRCAELVVGHVGAAFAGIWTAESGGQCSECANAGLCTDQSRCLHVKASAGLFTNLYDDYRRAPLGTLQIRQIAKGMGVMSINDILNDERLPNKDWIRENGLQSFAGFPLYVADKVFGVLAVFARSPLSAATLQTLESASDGMAATITRKQAKDALRLTKFSMDRAADAVYWIDPHAKIINVNDAASAMLGYSKEELRAMTVHDLNPDFQADMWPGFWAETQRCRTMGFETFHRAKNGRLIPVEVSVNYLSHEGKEYHCAFARDITERKLAEEALRESEARYRTLVELSPSGVFVFCEGQTVYVNTKAATLLGAARPEEILTRSPFEFIHPDYHEEVSKNLHRVLAGETIVHQAERLCLKLDRTPVHVQVEAVRMMWEGKPAILGLFSDITERKGAEEALKRNEHQLRTVLDALPVGVWFTDRSGKPLLANPAARQIWSNIKQIGLQTPDNPSGWWEALDPASRPHRWALSHALTTGTPSLNETLDLEEMDGTRKTIRNTTVPVCDEAGTVSGAIILNEDLTDLRRAQEALKLTEFSVEHAVEGFFWISPQGKILNVNDSACRMLEYTREDLTTLTVHDLDPAFLPEAWPAHWEELKQQGSLTYESQHWSKTGRVLDTEVTVSYLYYDGQEYNCAIIRDISERKRAEAALRTSEARFRLLVEGAPLGIAIMDRQKRYVKVNQALCNLVGYREEELLGQTFALFTHPDDLVSNVEQADALFSASRPGSGIEKRYLRKTGETIWVTVNATSLAFPEEHEQHIIAIIEDTTDKKRSEQALRESQTRLTEAQRIAHIGSWELNVVDKRLTWSEEIYRILETDPQKFAASYDAFLELVHPEDRDLVHRAYTTSIAGRSPYDIVHRVLLPDGRIKFVRERCETFYSQDGHPLRSFGTIQDITEQKQVEETLQQHEQDLRHAMEERERISQDLHDGILQSLYAIGLGLESCKPLMRQRNYKKATDLLEQAVGQMNQVMGEVRNFIAGLDSDVLQGGKFSAALRAVVHTLIAGQPIHCHLAIDETSVSRLSTEQALHLMNIVREALSNSLRHGHATKATVSLKPLARSIRLTIRDNGKGFAPADVRGLGHGLSNMEARAKKMGGRIAIRSAPKHGARVTIDLPKENSDA
jgi:PAS domain S-box-containing protein